MLIKISTNWEEKNSQIEKFTYESKTDNWRNRKN